jgi:hypothetical protein
MPQAQSKSVDRENPSPSPQHAPDCCCAYNERVAEGVILSDFERPF